MSNLLDFQHELLEKGKAIYSIKRQQLNPTDLQVNSLQETEQKFDKDSYGLVQLREFILKNSELLTATGDTLFGYIDTHQNKVVLTVLEIKDENRN